MTGGSGLPEGAGLTGGVGLTGGTGMSEPAATPERTGRAEARTVTVTGYGTAEAAPDLLTLAVGVECRRDNAGDAVAAAGAASAAVTGAVRSRGVESRDIRTSGLNVRADVAWQEGRGQQVTGYVASSMLSVRLRDLPAGSGVIAAAVEAGGNDVRLDGVQLGFADATAVMAADSMSVEPGESGVSASVTVEWELLVEAAGGERGGPG
jgi:uncharacterized protein YggE